MLETVFSSSSSICLWDDTQLLANSNHLKELRMGEWKIQGQRLFCTHLGPLLTSELVILKSVPYWISETHQALRSIQNTVLIFARWTLYPPSLMRTRQWISKPFSQLGKVLLICLIKSQPTFDAKVNNTVIDPKHISTINVPANGISSAAACFLL